MSEPSDYESIIGHAAADTAASWPECILLCACTAQRASLPGKTTELCLVLYIAYCLNQAPQLRLAASTRSIYFCLTSRHLTCMLVEAPGRQGFLCRVQFILEALQIIYHQGQNPLCLNPCCLQYAAACNLCHITMCSCLECQTIM